MGSSATSTGETQGGRACSWRLAIRCECSMVFQVEHVWSSPGFVDTAEAPWT